MSRQKQLVLKLRKQRDLLSALIARVQDAEELSAVSPAYDSTTKQIEENLKNLKRFLLTAK